MRYLLPLVLIAAATTGPAWVGRFTAAGVPPAPWRMVKLPGQEPTSYRVAALAGRMAIEATVNSSMSLMARPISIDLKERPIACWRWYVDGPVAGADMTKKRGNDFAARLYIAFDMPDSELSGTTRLKLKMARSVFGRDLPDAALIYVWDNKHAVGTARHSPYTDRSQVLVAESGSGRARSWVSERADVETDFNRAFRSLTSKPIQLAVASDGDNTRSRNRAGFADIHFVGRGQPCSF